MNGSDHVWVELALFSLSRRLCIYSAYSLASNKFLTSRISFWAISVGFLWTTIFLFDRGHAIGRCPITNRFEVLVFMTWSMVLIYLVIGSSYRLSLMGAFTAPVASVLLLLALAFAPAGQPEARRIKVNPWLEAHTSTVSDGRLRGVRASMHCRCHVSRSGAAIENPPTEFHFLPAPADHSVVGRQFASAVARFRSLYGRAGHRFFDRRADQLDAGWMVYPGLVRVRRHYRRSNAACDGSQMGCDPVDCRI